MRTLTVDDDDDDDDVGLALYSDTIPMIKMMVMMVIDPVMKVMVMSAQW